MKTSSPYGTSIDADFIDSHTCYATDYSQIPPAQPPGSGKPEVVHPSRPPGVEGRPRHRGIQQGNRCNCIMLYELQIIERSHSRRVVH